MKPKTPDLRPGRLARFALALLLFLARPALAQGTDGLLPGPRTSREVERWLADERVPDSALEAALGLHAGYLDEYARLRDGEIEAWLRERWIGLGRDRASGRAALDGITAWSRRQRALLARIDSLEDRFWHEVGTAASLDPTIAERLRERGRLRRLATFKDEDPWWDEFPRAIPLDLAGLIAAVKADPAEAARLRQALAGHDAELARWLEPLRDFSLERNLAGHFANYTRCMALSLALEVFSLARDEEGMGWAWAPSGLDPSDRAAMLAEFTQRCRWAAGLIRLQVRAIRTIGATLDDPWRCGAALQAVGLSQAASRDLLAVFEHLVERDSLAREAIETLAARSRRDAERQLPRALEQAELMARILELPDLGLSWQPNGSRVETAERTRLLRRWQELKEMDALDSRARMEAAEAASAPPEADLIARVGVARFAEAFRNLRRESGTSDTTIRFELASVLATAGFDPREAIEPSAEGQPSEPTTWRAMDATDLEAILDDLGVDEDRRMVARQLLEDHASRLRTTLESTRARLPRGRFAHFLGGSVETLSALDTSLRQVIEFDAEFFRDLASIVGSDGTESLRIAQTSRKARFIAGLEAFGAGWPIFEASKRSLSVLYGIDLVESVRRTVPEALRDPRVRSALLAHAERLVPLHEERWASMMRQVVRSSELAKVLRTAPQEDMSVLLRPSRQIVAIHEQVRRDLAEIEAILEPHAAAALRGAVWGEAWAPCLGRSYGPDAIGAADESASDPVFELLVRTSDEIAAKHGRSGIGIEPGPGGAGSWLETQTWVESALERARFRLGELEAATARSVTRHGPRSLPS